MRRASSLLAGLGAAAVLAAAPARAGGELRDLYFGEALFYADQGQYFDALRRLDTELGQYHGLDEPQYDSLHYHIGAAEFDVGDFELNYRMHSRAGRAIRAVLEGNVDDAVRNEAAYRLARIHFQKDQPEDALQALERIHGEVPQGIQDDVEFLRANVLLALDRPAEAIVVLERLDAGTDLSGFVAYNLGIAMLRDGRSDEGIEQLDRAGRGTTADKPGAAIRDKSNLLAGTLWFEAGNYDRAQQAFDRVRLDGPYSNQALLRAGWSAATSGRYDRALVPWNLLASRDVTDAAVQEALLTAPDAYGHLEVYGRAAVLYGQALETYTGEIDRIDASVDAIRKGGFLAALVREEVRHDDDWVVRLRELPETPETYYLTELLASHDFHTGLQNYLDLEDLRSRLVSWTSDFDAYQDVIELRRQNFEPLLPAVDAEFRDLDSRIRLRMEQRQHLEERLQGMLTAPRPDYLATADERSVLTRLAAIDAELATADDPATVALRERVAHLRGAIDFRLRTEYHERFTAAHEHLRELNDDIAVMNARYVTLVRVRQAATQSYVGYDVPIERLRKRVDTALAKVKLLMARQGHLLEVVAIEELQVRRERLVDYQAKARFAVADSYDRATRVATHEVPQ